MRILLVLIFCLGAPTAIAQSVVLNAVMNNASYAPPGSANEGIAYQTSLNSSASLPSTCAPRPGR